MEPSRYDRRAQIVTWYSPALGVSKRFHLYLPHNYAESAERYPVLYLLRGHEREWLNIEEDRSRNGINVLDVYEHLFDEGRVGPMILVMPSLTSDDGVVHGLGAENLAPELAGDVRGVGSGRWERYLVDDLLPLVDTYWRTYTDGAHRGVDGFSLGGAVAIKLAAKYPALFRSAGAYDGTFFFAADDTTVVRADDSVLRNPVFDVAFGKERNLQHVTANSPANLIYGADPAALARITWLIQYGPEHVEPWGSNYYRGEHLLAALRERGIANALGEATLHDGDHTWRTADRHMAFSLPIHWQVLSGGSSWRRQTTNHFMSA